MDDDFGDYEAMYGPSFRCVNVINDFQRFH